VVGLQSLQTVIELSARAIAGSIPSLGRDPHLTAPVLGHEPHALLTLSLRVDPGRVKVADAPLQRPIEDGHRLLLATAFLVHEALATQAEDGHFLTRLAKRSRLHTMPPCITCEARDLKP
jgi:hypothetical protein